MTGDRCAPFTSLAGNSAGSPTGRDYPSCGRASRRDAQRFSALRRL